MLRGVQRHSPAAMFKKRNVVIEVEFSLHGFYFIIGDLLGLELEVLQGFAFLEHVEVAVEVGFGEGCVFEDEVADVLGCF